MRVLQVIDSLRLGGAEVLLRDMALCFRERGVEFSICVLDRSGSPLEQSLLQSGVKLLDTGGVPIYSARQVPALARIMRGFGLVHVHLFPAQLWAALGAIRLSQTTLITTEHNTWNARRRWWLRQLDRWMYSRYAAVACNSQATADELVRWCPSVAGRTWVVPNGIPLQKFFGARPLESPLAPAGVIKAVFVGRFEPQKDHATLLRAFVRVPGMHLVLVGDGPLRQVLEQQVRDLAIADRVHFLGFRDDVPRILKSCDIYVHSTTSDGFGIAACEAMAAGLPVIASDVPGLAQVVEGAGVVFRVGDDEGLAAQLKTIVHSAERREQMADAGRRRAAEFSIERTVDQYIDLYESVLHQREPQPALA